MAICEFSGKILYEMVVKLSFQNEHGIEYLVTINNVLRYLLTYIAELLNVLVACLYTRNTYL